MLVEGELAHYELNQIPCFFGNALVDAHSSETSLKAIGLFMYKELVADSDIFPTTPFTENFHFVYITQSLSRIERGDLGNLPVEAWLMEETDELYLITPEVLYLQRLMHFALHHPASSVRVKYSRTLDLFRQQYPRTLDFLQQHNFKIEALAPSADWSMSLGQWPQRYDWAVKSRTDY